MIRHLEIHGGTGSLDLVARADGVVAHLAARVRKAPWCTFDGAQARWYDNECDRSFVITPERWRYILDRAHGERPDPGTAENVVELLWTDSIAAKVVLGVSHGGLFTEPTAEVVVGDAGLVCGVRLPVIGARDPHLAARAYLDILRSAARDLPTEIEITEETGEGAFRRRHDGKAPRTFARCIGCGEQEEFAGTDGLNRSPAPRDFVVRIMRKKHPLCGLRYAKKIAEVKESRAFGSPMVGSPPRWDLKDFNFGSYGGLRTRFPFPGRGGV